MKDFFFKPEYSWLDSVMFGACAIEFSHGNFGLFFVLTVCGLSIHLLTTKRFYD